VREWYNGLNETVLIYRVTMTLMTTHSIPSSSLTPARDHDRVMAEQRAKIYLCGGINGLSDSECRDWREKAKELLHPHECLDPMRHDYRGLEAGNELTIVTNDINDIRRCSFVLANVSRPSWGTAMEICIADDMGKRVIAFGAGDKPSPWLVVHCELKDSLEAACREIVKA
jgi:nucleoside 2-deoxyribosyltransferase